ncbi:MAG: glycosyltransferase [Pirellulaceae bacterium]
MELAAIHGASAAQLANVREQLLVDEQRVLDNINEVLHGWSRPPLARVSQLYSDVDECFLATFRELDHYSMRGHARFWGAWPNQGGATPQWPSGGIGKRVFAYLHRFKMLPNTLQLLKENQVPTIVYCDALTPQLRRDFESESLRFAERPLDLSQVGPQSDLAILNGGHGATVSMLLAGTPILQLPCQLEQTHTGRATVRLGAGLSVEPDRPSELPGKLAEMLASDRYRKAAQRFAARYVNYDAHQQLDSITDHIEELANASGERLNEESSSANQTRRDDPIQLAAHSAGGNDAPRRLILGIGTGRCGTRSLATLLNHQPSTAVAHELRPLLPWDRGAATSDIKTRFDRFSDGYPQVQRIGDVAQFYLPYVELALEVFHDVRVLCLQRNRQETIDSFLTWIVQTRHGRPVNHWSAEREGFAPDDWDACFPKYATRDMAQAIGRYWDEYYRSAAELVGRFPSNVRIFPTAALGEPDGVRALLDWASVPRSQQVLVKSRVNSSSIHSDTTYA